MTCSQGGVHGLRRLDHEPAARQEGVDLVASVPKVLEQRIPAALKAPVGQLLRQLGAGRGPWFETSHAHQQKPQVRPGLRSRLPGEATAVGAAGSRRAATASEPPHQQGNSHYAAVGRGVEWPRRPGAVRSEVPVLRVQTGRAGRQLCR